MNKRAGEHKKRHKQWKDEAGASMSADAVRVAKREQYDSESRPLTVEEARALRLQQEAEDLAKMRRVNAEYEAHRKEFKN
jgi:hypothetical protein